MVKVKNRKIKDGQIENLPFLDDRYDDEFDSEFDAYDDGKSAAIAATKKKNKKPKKFVENESFDEDDSIDYDNDDTIQFFALGGMEHIGQNMYVYKYRGKYLIVDCGLGFLDTDVGADDVKYCDTTWLEKHKKDVLGFIITHGHEDHMGALKYIWPKFKSPIYMTRFPAEILRRTFDGIGVEYKKKDIIVFDHMGAKFKIGDFDIETFAVSHSIPEAQMLIISTKAGKILHTGDFRFADDVTPESFTDYQRLKEIGSDPKLLACMCDSTSINRQTPQVTEMVVNETLEQIMEKAPGRVIVSGYARSLTRIRMFAEAARRSGREPAIKERSNPRPVPYCGLPEFREIGVDFGYLSKDEVALHRDIKDLPAERQAIFMTGHQGEKYAMLTRLCRGHVKEMKLNQTDTVVFSAIIIPGREQAVSFLYNRLAQLGVTTKTIFDTPEVHANGHLGRPEYEKFYDLVHPQVIVPMHGEFVTELLNAKMAMERGGAKHMAHLKNGEIVALRLGHAPVVINKFKTGFIVMEGETERMGNNDPVLKNRAKLSTEGAVFVTLSVDKRGYLKDTPEVSSAGVFEHDQKGLIKRQIQIEITKAIDKMGKGERKSQESLRQAVQTGVRNVIRPLMGDRKSPATVVHFVNK